MTVGFRGKRDRRERAALAVTEAKRAERETQKLARRLSSAARAELQQVAVSVHEEILRAGRDIQRRPGRARRRAGRAAARLTSFATPGAVRGDSDRRAGVSRADVSGADAAKARSKLIKRRRAEAKQAQQMAKIVAAQMAVAAVVTPTDAEHREHEVKPRTL